MEHVLRHFGLTGREKRDRQVNCPFHDDSNASASINLKKGLLHCFTCKRGWKLDEVDRHLAGREEPKEEPMDEVEVTGIEGVTAEDLSDLASQYLRDRGILEAAERAPLEVTVGTEPAENTFGYLLFVLPNGKYVGRNLLESTKERPRYRNSAGNKALAWVTERKAHQPVWLTEGLFDALSLAQVGVENVAAVLGSELSDEQCYELRGETVFIAFDADAAGFIGAKEAAKKLLEFEVTPIVVELAAGRGKDFNELLVKDPKLLSAWVEKQKREFGRTDSDYLLRQFENTESLQIISTGIQGYDEILGGGFRSGLNTLGAEPGAGKTAFVLAVARRAVEEHGKRVLVVTYEISKRQNWARLASMKDPLEWEKIERDWSKLKRSTKDDLLELGQSLRVAVALPVAKIQHAAKDFDVVIVDYVQRMPGPYGANDSRHNVDHNIERLSDLARDHNKIVIAVSSMPRSDYGGRITKKSFKESGGIEYMSQTLTGFQLQAKGAVMGVVVKNTRGKEGTFWMQTDLGHCKFSWSKPPGGK